MIRTVSRFVPVVLALLLLPISAYAVPMIGVTTTNTLVAFDSATPGTITSTTPITGLAVGESILGVDFRPATGALYGLGSTSRLYVINPTTGAATVVGTAGAFTLSGTEFGFDFNPTVDRIRVNSDADQNIRLNPDTGGLAATDLPLAFAGTDVNAGMNAIVGGAGYTNSFASNFGGTTTLFDIDSNLNILVTQNPPNNGTLNTVGPLGVDTTAVLGFDIDPAGNTAYAALQVGATSSLYSINLATGAATLIGPIGAGLTVRGLAVSAIGAFGNAIPALSTSMLILLMALLAVAAVIALRTSS